MWLFPFTLCLVAIFRYLYCYCPFLIFLFSHSPFLSLKGEGNEEISNMIHNYIKEIEDLRYLHNVYLDNFCFKKIMEVLAMLQLFSCVVLTLGEQSFRF